MAEAGKKLYPNCDLNVWLRTCEEEVIDPLEGTVTGKVPSWVQGTLLRNGPGSLKVGSSRFQHVFDGSALMHRFHIKDGRVTYQCRFVRTNTWQKNHRAQRILFTEFGTKSVPDPCHTIFDRLASVFKIGGHLTDNTMVSVYPFGDEIYTLTEVSTIHRIDPVTLETLEKRNPLDSVVVTHTAHPHVMRNGDVYNLGIAKSKGTLQHVIVKFPFTEKGDMFDKAHIVSTVAPRRTMYPSYMHSFGVTENHFVLIEQPLSLSLYSFIQNQLYKEAFSTCLKWYPDKETCIVVINRNNGVVKRYRTETLMFFHIINSYEEDGKLFVDLCTYKDARVIEAMYVKAIEGMQTNKDFASWNRSRPRRIEIPLDAPEMSKVECRLLADIGCEIPQIHYDKFNGLPYRYFYGCGVDVDIEHACPIIKIDTKTGETKLWYEAGWSPGEPVFIARPDAQEEDDGVLLSGMVRECAPDSAEAHELALLVLDARSLRELARASFRTPTPSPKSLHGWFLPEKRS
ncbi:carotenoid isomerooxygenase-like [Epargyreus clarus]|uniref:carotenoid isomerooxygenase-like n=1 Tax=Epargyreus clarus TaxID=520877 RepID=UPI003C2F454F